MRCLILFGHFSFVGYKGRQKTPDKQAIAKKSPTNSEFVGRFQLLGVLSRALHGDFS
jgi:hypothetical protein